MRKYRKSIWTNNLAVIVIASVFCIFGIIISAVLAVVGGIAAYFLFVSKKNNGEYTGFVAWLHDFLNFKIYFNILKNV